MPTATVSQVEFYRGFLMSRRKFEPEQYGVDMSRDDFDDQVVDIFNRYFGDGLTIDELCLHPRQAIRFCDDVRTEQRWWDVPDDIILRVIMGRRKHP